jgi:hypothetical protein
MAKSDIKTGFVVETRFLFDLRSVSNRLGGRHAKIAYIQAWCH